MLAFHAFHVLEEHQVRAMVAVALGKGPLVRVGEGVALAVP